MRQAGGRAGAAPAGEGAPPVSQRRHGGLCLTGGVERGGVERRVGRAIVRYDLRSVRLTYIL